MRFSSQECIDKIQTLAKELRRAPGRKEYDRVARERKWPLAATLCRHLDTKGWDQVLQKSGVENPIFGKKEIDQCLDRFFADFSLWPTLSQYRSWRSGRATPTPSVSQILLVYQTWPKALESFGLLPGNKRWDKGRMLEAIFQCANEAGRLPNYQEYDQWASREVSRPPARSISRYFGNWRNALFDSELDTSGRPTLQRFSKETLAGFLNMCHEDLGCCPTASSYTSWRKIQLVKPPDVSTFVYHFGSWKKALLCSGISR